MKIAKNQVLYEQTPWDISQVEAINPRLKDTIVADGDWHPFEHPPGVSFYRVEKLRYFQALYSKTENATLQKLKTVQPIATEDDAEWMIWKKKDGYAITSVFTLTPGPFGNTAEVASWLERHGLGFEEDQGSEDKGSMRGVAYFAEIEQGCLTDAIQRLAWLEALILNLNQQLSALSVEFWEAVRQQSQEVVASLGSTFPLEEIMPVPATPSLYGQKSQVALPQPDEDK